MDAMLLGMVFGYMVCIFLMAVIVLLMWRVLMRIAKGGFK